MTAETSEREGHFIIAAAQNAHVFLIGIFDERHLGRTEHQRRIFMCLHPKATLIFLLLPPLSRRVPERLIGLMWLHHLLHPTIPYKCATSLQRDSLFRSMKIGSNVRVVCSVTLGIASGSNRACAESSSFVV